MLGATLDNPQVDYGALPYGDGAVVQQWLTRCPPGLAPALRVEASPGEHFRNAYYDPRGRRHPRRRRSGQARLRRAEAASPPRCWRPTSRSSPGGSTQVIGWLDPEVSAATQTMLIQRDHPLRRLWPEDNRLPRVLRERLETVEPSVRDTLLATMYAADLAWCRLGGGVPAGPGIPVLGRDPGGDPRSAARHLGRGHRTGHPQPGHRPDGPPLPGQPPVRRPTVRGPDGPRAVDRPPARLLPGRLRVRH